MSLKKIFDSKVGILIICMLSALFVIVGFIVVGKVNNKCVIDDEINDNVEGVVDNKTEDVNIYGHTLSEDIGKFIVSKKGDVYFIPSSNPNFRGVSINLDLSNESIFIKGTYTVEEYFDSPDSNGVSNIEGYKINLSNIRSAYSFYFGQSGSQKSILFLDVDGRVNELVFEDNFGMISTSLFRNVENLSNIVTVVDNTQCCGEAAMLIDKNGNQIGYSGLGKITKK